MGSTPTLPLNRQPPPTSHHRRSQRPGPNVDRDLVPGVDPTPAAGQERDGNPALQETARLHRELAQTQPATRTPEQEPLGRRLPAPLDAARQGMER